MPGQSVRRSRSDCLLVCIVLVLFVHNHLIACLRARVLIVDASVSFKLSSGFVIISHAVQWKLYDCLFVLGPE